MQDHPDKTDEHDRLEALRRYAILDTAYEPAFDNITALAAHLCEAPISLVTLVDEDRQWFKSRFGWDVQESSRAISFCSHVIEQSGLLIVEDAARDERFATNPLVTGDPGIRFYAGAPLIDPGGHALGTLCVIDRQPRQLKEDHAAGLRVLRDQVMTLLELRHRTRELDFFEGLINSLPGMFYMFDEAGRFHRWNHRFEEATGYSQKEVLNLHPLDLFAGNDRQRIKRHIAKVFSSGRTEVEAEMVRRDCSTTPYYYTGLRLTLGDKTFLVGMGVDIGPLRETEKALRESEERNRTLVESARDAILTVNAGGEITSANNAFQVISQWEPASWLGLPFDKLLHADDVATANQAFATLLSQKEIPSIIELRVMARDGTHIPVEVTAALIENSSGETGAMIIARDIREKKVLDEQLQRTNRMDAVGELAASVAHDFNNILMVIHGSAEVLTDDRELPEQAQESLKLIRDAADRGQHITHELLKLGRDQAFHPRAVDLGQLVTRFTPMLERLLDDSHILAQEFDNSLPPVWCDQGMVEQALMNLVINARDAMPKGGEIRIDVSLAAVDDPLASRHPHARPGPRACLSVTDTGVGIDPAHLDRIFEPLFTTKKVGEGSGLGLAIIFRIVRRHEGWVDVVSEVGKGSKFSVFLPLASVGDTE